MMKLLGLSGAHKMNGNTDQLVERVLSLCSVAGIDTEFISLADLDVRYCTDCGACRESVTCSIEDDVTHVLEKMREVDVIVVGSPTYFGCVSGKLKAFFDRTLPLRRNGFLLEGKYGGALAVGGSRNGGQEYALRDIHAWMMIHCMNVFSDKGNSHFGGICAGRNPGDALLDEGGLKTVDGLAERIIGLSKDG